MYYCNSVSFLKVQKYGNGEKIWSWGRSESYTGRTQDLGDNANMLYDAIMMAVCNAIFIWTHGYMNPNVSREHRVIMMCHCRSSQMCHPGGECWLCWSPGLRGGRCVQSPCSFFYQPKAVHILLFCGHTNVRRLLSVKLLMDSGFITLSLTRFSFVLNPLLFQVEASLNHPCGRPEKKGNKLELQQK